MDQRPEARISRRAIWGLVLVGLALPVTFLPFFLALSRDQGESTYRATTLLGIPLGTAGLLLALVALVDIPQSDGHLKGRGIAITAVVLGAIGAAAATPLILGAIFGG